MGCIYDKSPCTLCRFLSYDDLHLVKVKRLWKGKSTKKPRTWLWIIIRNKVIKPICLLGFFFVFFVKDNITKFSFGNVSASTRDRRDYNILYSGVFFDRREALRLNFITALRLVGHTVIAVVSRLPCGKYMRVDPPWVATRIIPSRRVIEEVTSRRKINGKTPPQVSRRNRVFYWRTCGIARRRCIQTNYTPASRTNISIIFNSCNH